MTVTPANRKVSIEALGVHLPLRRLSRQSVAEFWGAAGGAGTRSVANWDEDAITMAVEAAFAVFHGRVPTGVDGLIFATTSPVYVESQHAALIAEVFGMRLSCCLDVTGSLRAGVDAVNLASSLVQSGRCSRVLVLISDKRDLSAGSDDERASGDAGVAVVVGDSETGLQMIGESLVTSANHASWRMRDDHYTRSGDQRFVSSELIEPWLTQAVNEAVTSAKVEQAEYSVIASSAAVRSTAICERSLSSIHTATQSPIAESVGFTGAAAPLLELWNRSPDLPAGSIAVVAAAGDGASAFVGITTNDMSGFPSYEKIETTLNLTQPMLVSDWLRVRDQVPVEVADPFTSEVIMARDTEAVLALQCYRCRKCAAVQYPPRRICWNCRSKDDFDKERLPRDGTLVTFTTEHLYPGAARSLTMGVVDVGDARVYTQVSDIPPDDCHIDLPVTLTLRRIHCGNGVPHYFWKATNQATYD